MLVKKNAEIMEDLSSILELWGIDPNTLLEKIISYVGFRDAGFRVVDIYERFNDKKNQLVIGYFIKDLLEYEVKVFIVCAEDPVKLYAEIRREKLDWRDYKLYTTVKSTSVL